MDLTRFGWCEHFAAALTRCAPDLLPGRVATETRSFYQIWTAEGVRSVQLAGVLKESRPVTGDWVAFDPVAGRIDQVLTRRSKISRKKAGRATAEQVLAANVDVLFIVAGLDQDFNVRRLERYLLMARENGVQPILVLNKCDLETEAASMAAELDAVAQGTPIILMSALDGDSVGQLHAHMEAAQTAVVVGSSGAGKSTIVNQLLGSDQQATREVRRHDSRGHHTTRSREMFLIGERWLLIDTPGIRELEPWVEEETAGAVFDDIEALAAQCRFSDCRHETEPGCAVRDAVDGARLAGYRRLQQEIEEQQRRRQRIGKPSPRTGR